MQLMTTTVFCQDNTTALVAAFNQYQQYSGQEQLFVHTDKNFYLAGEILWFKVYAMDITFHKPIDISKVTYAELLDTSNLPLLQAKIAMNGSTGNGSLYLPLTLTSGNYKLRAYTNWMKNGGPECFFEKIITIVNAQKTAPRAVKETATAYHIQFFPEGGNLVAGLSSKIAFKVTDDEGNGMNASGYILDNSDTIAKLTATHAGMGNFWLKPAINHTYTAIIKTAAHGETIRQALPAVYASGLVMHVADSAGKLTVEVQSGNADAGAVYLLVHAGSAIQLAQEGSLQSGSITFNIDKQLLREGISHFTIFNASRQPLCERLYFKRPAAVLNITAATTQQAYTTRSLVSVNVAAPGLQKKDAALLSMSVYRLDSLQAVDENTIASYVLLSSGLKGYIEDIGYYFTQQNTQAGEDLTNVLLVNGWSRFKWEEVLKNNQSMFAYVPEFNGHIITGKITNTLTGKPQPNAEVYLSMPGLRTQFTAAVSDTNGNIKFEMKDGFGASGLIVQAKAQTGTYKIQIDDPFSKEYAASLVPPFYLPAKNPNTLLDQSISMQVQNIYAAGKLNQFYLQNIDTTAFYSSPDSKYNLDDYTRFSTMEEVLREYVALVNLTRRSGKYHIEVFDKGHDVPFKEDPLVLLDGVPVLDFNKLLTIDPLKVKTLDVVQKKYFMGAASFNGILNWKTYAGDLANYELDPAAINLDYEGLQLNREFYAPVYAGDKASHVPDFRNVLYWNPDITLTDSKEQQFHFYTSDLPGKYVVITQGISTGGLCGSAVNMFEVKE